MRKTCRIESLKTKLTSICALKELLTGISMTYPNGKLVTFKIALNLAQLELKSVEEEILLIASRIIFSSKMKVYVLFKDLNQVRSKIKIMQTKIILDGIKTKQ